MTIKKSLDISKALDKLWHERIFHKLKRNEISGNLLSLLTDFLRNRKQGVILNDQRASRANITAGVPQGSILGLLLFLIYINDLSVLKCLKEQLITYITT